MKQRDSSVILNLFTDWINTITDGVYVAFGASLVKCSIHRLHQMQHPDNKSALVSSDYDNTAIFWTVEVCQCEWKERADITKQASPLNDTHHATQCLMCVFLYFPVTYLTYFNIIYFPSLSNVIFFNVTWLWQAWCFCLQSPSLPWSVLL